MSLRKLAALIAFSFFTHISFSQGIDNYSKSFTKYDLYKWCSDMSFKPKYFEQKSFQNFLLKMDDHILEQWHIELVVTYEDFKNGNESMMFVFKTQLKEYYGNFSEDMFNRWYIPYYVFLQLDKWAADQTQKRK